MYDEQTVRRPAKIAGAPPGVTAVVVAFACGLTLATLFSASRASAHGAPPAANELLADSDQSATLVRLLPAGLALRVPEGFRYICPEAWGGDALAPAAAAPQGPAIIASDSLSIVGQDGRISPHAVQSGSGVVATRSRDAVFVVFKHEGRIELRRVTGTTNELVRVLEQPFGALIAGQDELSLLRWTDATLVLQKVSHAGALLGSLTWTMPSAIAYARFRMAGNQLYVVVWGRSAPWVTLGRISDQGYVPISEASVDIAGPASLGTGTLVAVDGTLQSLETGSTVDTQTQRITCLGERAGQAYACALSDLFRVGADGLGTSLFDIGALVAPSYEGLSEVARADCSTRWLEVQNDLALARAIDPVNDAGVTLPDETIADATIGDGSVTSASGANARGCSAASAAPLSSSSVVVLALALSALGRRRARR